MPRAVDPRHSDSGTLSLKFGLRRRSKRTFTNSRAAGRDGTVEPSPSNARTSAYRPLRRRWLQRRTQRALPRCRPRKAASIQRNSGAPRRIPRGLAVIVVDVEFRNLEANPMSRALIAHESVFAVSSSRLGCRGPENVSYFLRLVRRACRSTEQRMRPAVVRRRQFRPTGWLEVIIDAAPAASGWGRAALILVDVK